MLAEIQMQPLQRYPLFKLGVNNFPRLPSYQVPMNSNIYQFQREPNFEDFRGSASPSSNNWPGAQMNGQWGYNASPNAQIWSPKINPSHPPLTDRRNYGMRNQFIEELSFDADKHGVLLRILDKQQQAISKMAQDIQNNHKKMARVNEALNQKLRQIEEALTDREDKVISRIEKLNQSNAKKIPTIEHSPSTRQSTCGGLPSIELNMANNADEKRKEMKLVARRTERPRPTYVSIATKSEF